MRRASSSLQGGKDMWKQIVAGVIMAAVLAAAGCSTMGEYTGKAVRGVENAAGDFKSGYQRGKRE